MSRIQKVSTYLIWVLNVLLISIPLISFSFWPLLNSPFMQTLIKYGITFDYMISTPEGPVPLSNMHLTLWGIGAGILGDVVGLAPILLGLIALKRLFQNYSKGNIFSLENAYKYKRLGWLFFWNGLLAQPISGMLHVLAVTYSNPPGHRYIAIGLGTPSFASLVYGMLILVISWVMVEAYKLQEDKNLTI